MQQRNDPKKAGLRVNRDIRAREVRLIDQDGQQQGVVPRDEALRMADNAGLDLVEVVASSTPPVCKILDYGKYRYDQTKRERESKKSQHQTKVKEVKVKPNISDHDFDFKLKHARNFLSKGHKVKITCTFRGREMAHTDVGHRVVKRMVQALEDLGRPEAPLKMMGRMLSTVVAPGARKKD